MRAVLVKELALDQCAPSDTWSSIRKGSSSNSFMQKSLRSIRRSGFFLFYILNSIFNILFLVHDHGDWLHFGDGFHDVVFLYAYDDIVSAFVV